MCSKLMALKLGDLLFYFFLLITLLFVFGNIVSYFAERPKFQEVIKYQRDPDVFIIGAKKCGTQALAEFLNIHPNVEVAKEEFPFFSQENLQEYGYEWLRNRMPFTSENQLTVVRTPEYFQKPEVPRAIFKMNKNIKIILMLRDPVSRLMSDYLDQKELHSRSGNSSLSLGSFEEVFLQEEAVMEPSHWLGSPPVALGFYSLHLAPWLYFFTPGEKLLVLTNEELVRDPVAVMAKVQLFLGLEPLITDGNFFAEPGKAPFQCYLTRKPLLRKVCLPPSKGRQPPFVPKNVLDRVRQFYAPHMRDLQLKLPSIKSYWP